MTTIPQYSTHLYSLYVITKKHIFLYQPTVKRCKHFYFLYKKIEIRGKENESWSLVSFQKINHPTKHFLIRYPSLE